MVKQGLCKTPFAGIMVPAITEASEEVSRENLRCCRLGVERCPAHCHRQEVASPDTLPV
jgi:hypothetical protein